MADMKEFGAAEEHLEDPKSAYNGGIARDSAVVREIRIAIDELGRPVAKRGNFSPRVEA